MLCSHPNFWPGTTVNSFVGSALVLSHPSRFVNDLNYVGGSGKQTISFTTRLSMTYDTNLIGIGMGTRSLTLLGPGTIHAKVWPGYIHRGMSLVHPNIIAGTRVQSYSRNVGRGSTLILSQPTLTVGDSGYISGSGKQSVMFTPSSFQTTNM